MFDSVDVLVDESDRRRAIVADMAVEEDEETLELVQLIAHLNNPADDICSQSRTFRGYELLVQNIPTIEEKLLSMDVDELVVYFRDVSYLNCLLEFLLLIHHSYARARAVLEVMIRRI